jgi:NADH:ubiquinone oxidoreductase subunit
MAESIHPRTVENWGRTRRFVENRQMNEASTVVGVVEPCKKARVVAKGTLEDCLRILRGEE